MTTAVSLFSGAGGLDCGFEQAGYEIIFANEFDHDAANAWKKNRPGKESVMVEGDINAHLDDLKKFSGAVDIVFGGPPCQGFSVAGKMDPSDPRSALVWSFLKAVEIVRPKVFVIENVKALGVLSKWESVRNGILKKSEELGYETKFQVLMSSDYGVPENRERVIFVGVKQGLGLPENVFEALEAYKQEPPSLKEVLKGCGKFGSKENPQTCTANVTLAKSPVLRKSPYAGMLVNGAGRPINLDGCAPTLPASMGGNKTPIIDEEALRLGKTNWFISYHAKLMAKVVSPSEETVPKTIRRLTIKEAAAIQTFPKGYVFSGKKTKAYKQIGNAVPCGLAKAVASAIYDSIFRTCA